MTTEVRLQEQEPVDVATDVVPADAFARTAAADAQATLGQHLRAPDIPAQAGAGRADHELADGPSVDLAAAATDTEAPVEQGVCQFGAEGAEVVDEAAGGQPEEADEGAIARSGLRKRAPEVRADTQEAAPKPEQPRGPYYEKLMSEGDAGAALEPYLRRLAVTKDDYLVRGMMTKDMEGDDLDKGLLDRLSDEDGAQDNDNVRQLTDIIGHSMKELQANPELCEGGTANWLGLGTSLLDRAVALGEDADTQERQGLLVSAATASLMAENPDDRITFLQETAKRDMGAHMEKALHDSDVTIILDPYRNTDMRYVTGRNERSIHRMRNFGHAFLADAEHIERYQQLVERDLDEPVDAHTAMKDMMAGYGTADGVLHGGHAERLEAASVASPNVDRYRIDPTKANRFALQEMFVRAQMATLFPGGDDKPLRTQLAAERPDVEDADAALRKLRLNAEVLIQDTSKPATEQFTVPDGEPNESWSPEQLAAWRYQQLAETGASYDYIARFVDPTIFGPIDNFSSDVYITAEDGAAVSGVTTEAIRVVLHLADEYKAATGDRVSPAELRDLTQAKRRQLMKLAAISLDHLSATTKAGRLNNQIWPEVDPPSLTDATMYRRDDGTLDLDGPIFQPVKEVSSQSATRLACVALRVNIEGNPGGSDTPSRGKTNSIEKLAEVIIDEASERGIFGKEPLLTLEQEAEFNRMFAEHHKFLVGVARRFGLQDTDVEDLIQDTFFNAARSGKIFDPERDDNERSYLARVARNQFINQYRRAQRGAPMVTSADANELGLEQAVQPGPSVEQLVTSNDVRERQFTVWKGLMPEQHFRILILTEYYGMSYKDTAETLGVPIGSVMSGLHRAKKAIRAHELKKAGLVPAEA